MWCYGLLGWSFMHSVWLLGAWRRKRAFYECNTSVLIGEGMGILWTSYAVTTGSFGVADLRRVM